MTIKKENTVRLRALVTQLYAAAEKGDEQQANKLSKALLMEIYGERWEPRIVFYPVGRSI